MCIRDRSFSTDILRLALTSCGLNSSRYKGHSFRIGAASFAADRGMSDAQIRALGRWKSSAFLKYIRLPSLSSTQLSSYKESGEPDLQGHLTQLFPFCLFHKYVLGELVCRGGSSHLNLVEFFCYETIIYWSLEG